MSYYDYMARVVQHRSSTHIGGVEKDWFLYDFVGNATKHKTEHKPGSGTSLIETTTQSYDTWDRPLVTMHLIGTSGTATTVSDKAYDKAGRLYTESRSSNTSLKSTYAYNIRSWLTGITGTLFTETLKYQDGTTARWGGDVSQLSWKDNRSSNLKTYNLAYDTVGRLTTASFSDAGNTSVNYAEKVTQYDGSGNIRKLERYGRTGASTYGKIDDLVYTYSGNKVTSIKDTGSAAYSSDFRFSNGTNNSYAFTYDAAGRMTSDASKGISSITWNVLGLPQTVTFSSGAVINYSYAADGTKLREAKTVSSTTTLTDYTGNLILENGTRSRLLFDGGYVSVSNSGYHFFLTDHLGSVRVVANTSGTAEEYNHYYPLGGLIAQYSSSTSLQPVKFQGKEWGAGKGLDLYDFGARRYDPATGRWISQDPLAEKYYAHSPYLFCNGKLMSLVDPNGREPIKPDAGTIGGFVSFMNSIPTGIGRSTGETAHVAMLRMGATKGVRPAFTAPFNVAGHNRYIYTETGGWIDMAHFMFYAGRAYSYKQQKQFAQEIINNTVFAIMPLGAQIQWLKQAIMDPVGESVQDGFHQEMLDCFTAPQSAYSYEDLPSDRYGAIFGADYFDPHSEKTFSEQIREYFDIILNGASPQDAPNYRELPTTYPKKPTIQNGTTDPLFVK